MESETEEWKESWHDRYLATLCAFASYDGGIFIIGKQDKTGKIVGVRNYEKLLEELPSTIRNKLDIKPSIRAESVEGKMCVLITVKPEGHMIDLDGRFYKRVGSTTHMVTREELRSKLLSDAGLSWTDLPSGDNIDSISDEAIEHFIKAGKKADRIPKDIEYNAQNVLERFGLIDKNGKITRAASLLFGKKSSNAFDGTYVKIGEFSEEGQLRREDRIFAPLIMQPDKVMDELFEKYVPGLYEYEGARRIVVFRYPRDAVREALINALMHKKYEAHEPVTVRVDPNSITIMNPGTLPDGWTVEDLKKPHLSVRRNQAIAEIFYKAGYVETWGKGISLIHDSCKENGNRDPDYEVIVGGFRVTFIPNRFIKYKLPLKLPEDLTLNEVNICKLIDNDEGITVKEMADHLRVNEKTVKRALISLTQKGIIVRVGPNKGGSWKFTNR